MFTSHSLNNQTAPIKVSSTCNSIIATSCPYISFFTTFHLNNKSLLIVPLHACLKAIKQYDKVIPVNFSYSLRNRLTSAPAHESLDYLSNVELPLFQEV